MKMHVTPRSANSNRADDGSTGSVACSVLSANPPEQTQALDGSNAEFWSELCGTQLAQSLGLTDHSVESLRRFDEAYLGFYPYLLSIVKPDRMKGKDVLEIGLGYGTLGQQIAQAGARYNGLDISPKPVEMMRHRLAIGRLAGSATQGSARKMPFPDDSFDFVVSIGCFHHTGDVQECFDETRRVLRPDGIALLMVYNKYSHRQWTSYPRRTAKSLWQDVLQQTGVTRLTANERRDYDENREHEPPPETVLLSCRDLRRMLHGFDRVALYKRNSDHIYRRRGGVLIDRMLLLNNLGKVAGLDIYVEAENPSKRERHSDGNR